MRQHMLSSLCHTGSDSNQEALKMKKIVLSFLILVILILSSTVNALTSRQNLTIASVISNISSCEEISVAGITMARVMVTRMDVVYVWQSKFSLLKAHVYVLGEDKLEDKSTVYEERFSADGGKSAMEICNEFVQGLTEKIKSF
jgi:hypothetical protein